MENGKILSHRPVREPIVLPRHTAENSRGGVGNAKRVQKYFDNAAVRLDFFVSQAGN